jgi:hypothetical protein
MYRKTVQVGFSTICGFGDPLLGGSWSLSPEDKRGLLHVLSLLILFIVCYLFPPARMEGW